MRIVIRKCILWIYVFLVTVIFGAVFIIGCDGGGTTAGNCVSNFDNCTNSSQCCSHNCYRAFGTNGAYCT
jgi:hypothetical protein